MVLVSLLEVQQCRESPSPSPPRQSLPSSAPISPNSEPLRSSRLLSKPVFPHSQSAEEALMTNSPKALHE
ncbi:hypothetical protein Q5P01_017485 [Channa striata]|uniref:Uncharacterized protein n=1 Tax=Channa striata TaxID=64152 RepID=A0AA88MBL3_CHASR|nr:hypothetical protein Q5P01_017485 [Channa striata]